MVFENKKKTKKIEILGTIEIISTFVAILKSFRQ